MNRQAKNDGKPEVKPVSRYLWVLAALLGMLLVSVLTSLVPLGYFNTLIVMVSAGAMALLVMTVFMHDTPAWRLTGLTSALGFVWLALLVGIMLTDFLARTPVPAPW